MSAFRCYWLKLRAKDEHEARQRWLDMARVHACTSPRPCKDGGWMVLVPGGKEYARLKRLYPPPR